MICRFCGKKTKNPKQCDFCSEKDAVLLAYKSIKEEDAVIKKLKAVFILDENQIKRAFEPLEETISEPEPDSEISEKEEPEKSEDISVKKITKKQYLILGVALVLVAVAGFFSGTIYSTHKISGKEDIISESETTEPETTEPETTEPETTEPETTEPETSAPENAEPEIVDPSSVEMPDVSSNLLEES